MSSAGGARGRGKHMASKVSRSGKASLQFPVGCIGRFLKAGKHAECFGAGAPVYVAAILGYFIAKVASPLSILCGYSCNLFNSFVACALIVLF